MNAFPGSEREKQDLLFKIIEQLMSPKFIKLTSNINRFEHPPIHVDITKMVAVHKDLKSDGSVIVTNARTFLVCESEENIFRLIEERKHHG